MTIALTALYLILALIWAAYRRWRPRRRSHVRVAIGGRCNLHVTDWHDWTPWSAPYGVAGETRKWRERRCRIEGCWAGQWEPVE